MAASIMFPRQADAALVLYAQEAGVNGGNPTLIASGADFTNASFTGTYGDFTLQILGTASHNTATLSSLLTSAVSLQNNSTGFQTLTLYASQTNFDLPAGPQLNVESGLGGSVNTGTLTGSGVFQAYLDSNNTLLGTGDFTNGPQNVTFTGSTFSTGSATGTFDRDNLNYSITAVIVANVSGGGEGNFASHINVTAVPEPGTLAMAFMAVPLMGVGYRLRRRRRELV